MSKTILVIEDNKKHRILFEDLLRGRGYDVAIAMDGNEVEQKMKESEKSGKQFNLLLVDIAMPRFDALSFIQAHKDNYQVLVVSAYADLKELDGILPDDRRIKKPFDINVLIRRVNEILG